MDIFSLTEGETKNNTLMLTKENNCKILGKIPLLSFKKDLKNHTQPWTHTEDLEILEISQLVSGT